MIQKLTLDNKNISETVLLMLQAALNEKCYAIDSVTYGFPPKPLPVIDDYQGIAWLVIWKNELRAVIRCAHEDTVRDLALDYCENTGSAFVSVDKADFEKEAGYHRAPSGKTVTKKYLELLPLTWAIYQEHKFKMVLRVELPFNVEDLSQLNIKSNYEESSN